MAQVDGASHILVIRLSAMGDVAMMVPVIRVLTATYPNLKITVLTRGFFAPMFKGIPGVAIYEADVNGVHSGVIGLGRLARDLRDTGIDKVADLHNVLRSNVLKSVFYMFGIPVKQIDKGRAEKKALTRDDNKVFKPLKSTIRRYADVFEALGYIIDLSKHQFPLKEKISEKIRDLVGTEPKKWLGIAPFAQHDSKAYPKDLMEEVLRKLSDNPKIKILLFGGGNKEEQQMEIWAAKYSNTISIAGKLTLAEELSLISNLDAMLSMDSGNGHMAAMYGIPVITIWGVTHPYAGFAPFNQPEENSLIPDLNKYPKIPTSVYGNKYPEGYKNAIGSILPESVLKKIEEVLF
ncbi:glycosyltransferase family 9 protein [Salegentibacter sp. Hel_I_6]|uniref:glycosyltransferase family 9 protein n=1 Tax=Salegentibacter sp. Hel_I_6 TaxID=1250278 RepID=UPI0005603D2B|nr:glycosyltransferase family 9 protein [Salegentibacter sp. Hel_I_6]